MVTTIGSNVQVPQAHTVKNRALAIADEIMKQADNDSVQLSRTQGEVCLKHSIPLPDGSLKYSTISKGAAVVFDPATKEINYAHFETVESDGCNFSSDKHRYTITREDRANIFSRMLGNHKPVIAIIDEENWRRGNCGVSCTEVDLDPETHAVLRSSRDESIIPVYHNTGGVLD